jgi:hypothetical protein
VTQQLPVRSSGLINFNFLWQRWTKEGARGVFEQLVEQVVGLQHPEVRSIEANPGDWGIDAFIGDLHEQGHVSIWQAKYFIEGFGKTQQADVREAYASAKAAAKREEHIIDAWTLCLPIYLDGPTSKWWANKKREWERDDGIIIDLWDEGQLRRRIMQQTDEAKAIYTHYFNPAVPLSLPSDGPPAAKAYNHAMAAQAIQDLLDPERYEDALFVEQLRAAQLVETRSAREAFYNAEILTHEIGDKGVPLEMEGLKQWRHNISSTWERHFNDVASRQCGSLLTGLYRSVFDALDEGHPEFGRPLRATKLHGQGLMHQQVDDGNAGWTRDWRKVAATFKATREPVSALPNADPSAVRGTNSGNPQPPSEAEQSVDSQQIVSGQQTDPDPGVALAVGP